jgi:hypothetical protein
MADLARDFFVDGHATRRVASKPSASRFGLRAAAGVTASANPTQIQSQLPKGFGQTATT